jgi:HEPN domain-containing protein
MTVPEKWTEQARYDLDTAKAMLAARRYLYVLFCCQQAVEKALKGLIAQRSGEMPPRLHSLMGLARKAGLEVDEQREEQLLSLSSYYVRSRYPEEIAKLSAGIDHALAEETVGYTEELLEWLSTLME